MGKAIFRFVFLPFTQAFLVWRILEGVKTASGTDSTGRGSDTGARRDRAPRRRASAWILLLVSIVLSNIVLFDLFGNFPGYGFLFWADLLLLVASYAILLPPARRWLRGTNTENGAPS